jgi:hypothetical protein
MAVGPVDREEKEEGVVLGEGRRRPLSSCVCSVRGRQSIYR